MLALSRPRPVFQGWKGVVEWWARAYAEALWGSIPGEVWGRVQYIISWLPQCRGRGCSPQAMGAAVLYYAARWEGHTLGAPRVYRALPWRRLPRQSFHNSLLRLLALLGHSPRFRRVLRCLEGALVCRRPGSPLVEWEAYPPVALPRCPGAVEEWCPARPPMGGLLWGRVMSVRVRAEFDALAVAQRLKQAFGDSWFTAAQASQILLLTPRSAATLLARIEEKYGIIRSRRDPGRSVKLYRVNL